MSLQHKLHTKPISFTAMRHIARYKTVIHALSCASCGVTVSACVVVATGVQGGRRVGVGGLR